MYSCIKGPTNMLKYRCPRCSLEVSYEAYKLSSFCPNCGSHLQEIRFSVRAVPQGSGEPKGLKPEDAYITKLFPVYLKSPIEVSVNNRFYVNEWVGLRKQAYVEYRQKFSPDNLADLQVVRRNFHSWLLFRNNLSWTTLQRTAGSALEHPQKLARLLCSLQNEDIEVADRVRSALQGTDKIDGIGKG